MTRPIAFVTGASRGIGRASAIALAKAGFDLALTARTLEEGDGRVERPHSTGADDVVRVEGSLASTKAAIEPLGAAVLTTPMDLLDRVSIDRAFQAVMDRFGRIDLLLNNAIWSGPGLLDPIERLDLDVLEKAFQANTFNQLYLTQKVLAAMVAGGGGQIFDMTSSAGQIDAPPYRLAEMGMLGFAHCATKGAFHRMAPLLQAEHAKHGVRAINLDPGFTQTESMTALGLPTLGAATPEVTGEVVAWLATHPEDSRFDGGTVDTHRLCAELGLVEGWPPESAPT